MALHGRLSERRLHVFIGCLVFVVALMVCLPLAWLGYNMAQLWYAETKGPFYNSSSTADLDGDGDLDVVVFVLREESETTRWGEMALYLNQGEGEFDYNQPDLPPLLYLSGDSGDLDGDGDVDIMLLSPGELLVLRNQGGGQSGTEGQYQVHSSLRPDFDSGTSGSLALVDLEKDGRLDVFVAGCCGMQVEWGDGSQTYLPSVSWVWNRADSRPELYHYALLEDVHVRALEVGDLNGDGFLDLWLAVQPSRRGASGELADRVLLNDGNGNLYDSSQRLYTGGSSAVALGDLDGDGDLDALVGTPSGSQVWINQAGAQAGQVGEFLRMEDPLAGGLVKYLFLEDFNRDGALDVLVGEAEQGRVWWNDGRGGFRAGDLQLRYSERQALGVGDFNNDGAVDVFAGAGQNNYRLWWNDGMGHFEP